MSSVKSIKQLLSAHDLTKPVDKDGKAPRHASHEFQAYAYRLAKDLNDLKNLKIYFRLSKTVDRSMLERAYSFAADSRTQERGRAFLWKLKQLRLEIKKKKEMKNFEYSFVMKKMKKLRNETLSELIEQSSNKDIMNILVELSNKKAAKEKKSLILGIASCLIYEMCTTLGLKVNGYDISTLYAKTMKNENTKFNVKTSDFIKSKIRHDNFDLVLISKYWPIIPLENEIQYCEKLSKIIKVKGKLILEYKKNDMEEKQSWTEIKRGENVYPSFTKLNTRNDLLQRFRDVGFKLKSELESGKYSYLVLEKVTS